MGVVSEILVDKVVSLGKPSEVANIIDHIMLRWWWVGGGQWDGEWKRARVRKEVEERWMKVRI